VYDRNRVGSRYPVYCLKFLQLFLQSGDLINVFGISIFIRHLIRILQKVIEFPFIAVVVEMHQLIPGIPDAVMAFNFMYTGIFIIVVVDILPDRRDLLFQQRFQGYTLHIVRDSYTGIIKNGFSEIKVLNHGIALFTSFDLTGEPY